ncbi:Clathrin light chain domain-containing protein [Rozella allomycis CSF55]|uniref:Clathrin light chain n=1 Tax=Rozella allomycis (strain CSF55) TaxID=988480 RepID=A0A075ARI3_ROZAC|nr:Clathrin light chain domain-containing protein [Rozella allomycis CSF55]|eukprot:EPZ31336.1 Clathrin light chain domain-containing protein [Rozella allomycis CSF55]
MQDNDPTAEFLAKEQELLKSVGESFNEFTSPIYSPDISMNPHESLANDVQYLGSAIDKMNVTQNESANPPGDFSNNSLNTLESQKINEWKVKFDSIVAERDQKSKERHELILKQAEEDLKKFYAEHNDKKIRKHEFNLREEEEFIKIRDEDPVGHRWDVVHQMVESVTKPKGSKDTSRMKGLFSELKGNPQAPGNQI